MTSFDDDYTLELARAREGLKLSPEVEAWVKVREKEEKERREKRALLLCNVREWVLLWLFWLGINVIVWIISGWGYFVPGPETPSNVHLPSNFAFIMRPNWLLLQVSVNVVIILGINLFGKTKAVGNYCGRCHNHH